MTTAHGLVAAGMLVILIIPFATVVGLRAIERRDQRLRDAQNADAAVAQRRAEQQVWRGAIPATSTNPNRYTFNEGDDR